MASGFLDTDSGSSAATQTFQAQRARSREQLQHARAGQAAAQAVEYGLFDKIGRRTNAESLRHFQDPPSRLTPCDAHGGDYLKISAKNCFMASQERRVSFLL